VERIGRAFEGVASQSCHVPQQNNFSTQNKKREVVLAERLIAEQLLDASCSSTEQLLDAEQLLAEQLLAEQLLAERLLAEQLLDAKKLSHRRLARTVVTNLESLLLRLAEKSSHVHITERVLHTEMQRTGSVAYHRDPASIGFDLPQG